MLVFINSTMVAKSLPYLIIQGFKRDGFSLNFLCSNRHGDKTVKLKGIEESPWQYKLWPDILRV